MLTSAAPSWPQRRRLHKLSAPLAILGDKRRITAQAGRLRIEHRVASLEQLARLADPPLSKDSIAGRIRRLIEMADRLDQTANPSHSEAM